VNMPGSQSPLFSVVIPTFNRAQKVVRTIESVLAQTLADFEIWVVDDGSTDQTAQVLRGYLDRIHYLPLQNCGAASARNAGIKHASGQYIGFLDSDDLWYPQKLESFASAIRSHPETGLFYSQWEVVNEAGQRLWIDRSRPVQGSGYMQLLMGDFLAVSSVVVKRDCLDVVGEFDPMLVPCEDWDLWLRISKQYPIYLVPDVLLKFEYSPHGKLTSNTLAWLEAHDRVIEKAFSRDPDLPGDIRLAVQANTAFIKGRICLEAKDDQEAARWFSQAISLSPLHLKAHLFRILSSIPSVRRLLPGSLRRRLHLPRNGGLDN